jgi:hypothetical protein
VKRLLRSSPTKKKNNLKHARKETRSSSKMKKKNHMETMLVILLPDVKNSNEMKARAPESSLVLVFRLLKSASN